MIGVFAGTAQKSNCRQRARQRGHGRFSLIVSRFPRAEHAPHGVRAAGAVRRRAEDVVEAVDAERARLGCRVRSIARSKAAAVTGWPDGGEKRYPGRIWKVYVRPPSETAGAAVATSGTSSAPAPLGLS